MGSWLSSLFSNSEEHKILLLGLDNAGKTTILYYLALNEVVYTRPTIGSNFEELVHKNIKFQCWDIGGQENLRKSWSAYYADTSAVIFVVDSTDHERLSTTRKELFKIIADEKLSDTVCLVFANKMDIKTSMKPKQLIKALKLTEIKNHDWAIKPCCALTGEGLQEGWEWMANKIQEKKNEK
ncbi:adp-ribosylation factor c1 [Anaeramoeba flamelloides]|uniref:Adp-ribosylation factor c1 n=1 Tax=Anaeramoeba flamelloides TaxID=1746091 RepID=A0AAV8ADA4_9EUKA|nr:adp-ribosylation factor c1 [Anaeramoeba flamelloides]KAJ6250769.1 adp-ribosylation factor c1 [Anaeramoeba flamelloides]